MDSEDPIEGILGLHAYAAALQDHLISLRSSISVSLFELKGCLIQDHGHAHLDAIRIFAKQSVGIRVQVIFMTKKNLNVRECIHGRGVGLCNMYNYIFHTNGHGKDVISRICYTHVTR